MKTCSFRIVILVLLLLPAVASAAEPRIFIMGIWPNRLRLFDEQSEEFIGDIDLRYGAVTAYIVTPHTADYRRLFFVTDRMESVEVVDPARREVVDELKISTPERRVRIFSVAPHPDGKLIYLHARGVDREIDRFAPNDFELLLYDFEAKAVKETVHLPDEVDLQFFDTLLVSSDGSSLFVIGRDVYELDSTTHEILDKITWSRPRSAGYGPIQGAALSVFAPGIVYGAYTTTDPLQQKNLSGVLRLDLNEKRIESFELGPSLNVTVFAVSPDGKLGFAGLTDMAVVDMEARRIIARKEGFERGRTNTVIIPSADGSEIYVTGVGHEMIVYDARTLERKRTIDVGGDLMSWPLALPREAVLERGSDQ